MGTTERVLPVREETTPPAKEGEGTRPSRRVGTFTMGLVLVLAGAVMLCAMFFPSWDYTWALKLSPLALVSLGTETLLSIRQGGRLKYDWVGMILCCLIVLVALAMFTVAWCVVYHPGWVNG